MWSDGIGRGVQDSAAAYSLLLRTEYLGETGPPMTPTSSDKTAVGDSNSRSPFRYVYGHTCWSLNGITARRTQHWSCNIHTQRVDVLLSDSPKPPSQDTIPCKIHGVMQNKGV
eukprot:3341350-Pyramimonas_sp.AAC.2